LQATLGRSGQSVANGLQTNGIVLDDEWGQFLAEYRFLIGLSLDGPSEVHDAYRGKGTHAQVLKAIKSLRRHEVEFNALVMVTPLSAARADDLYAFFERHRLRYLQFIPCAEMDPQTGQLAEFSVPPADYGEFLCRMFDRWASEDPPKTYIRLFDDLLAVYRGYQMPSCSFRDACGDYVVVEWNGDVYACDFFVDPEWKLGNLLETPLSEMVGSPRWVQFRRRKGRHTGRCKTCGWLSLCHGECPKYRLNAGDESGPSHFCEAYRRFFAYSQKRFFELAHSNRSIV